MQDEFKIKPPSITTRHEREQYERIEPEDIQSEIEADEEVRMSYLDE